MSFETVIPRGSWFTKSISTRFQSKVVDKATGRVLRDRRVLPLVENLEPRSGSLGPIDSDEAILMSGQIGHWGMVHSRPFIAVT